MEGRREQKNQGARERPRCCRHVNVSPSSDWTPELENRFPIPDFAAPSVLRRHSCVRWLKHISIAHDILAITHGCTNAAHSRQRSNQPARKGRPSFGPSPGTRDATSTGGSAPVFPLLTGNFSHPASRHG